MDNDLRKTLEDLMKAIAEVLAQLEEKPEETSRLTKRILLEIISHEAIVLEAYKDSVGVWTWGIGVTDKSGHHVSRYIDNPQKIKRCIEIFKWLLETKYLPDVISAFSKPLTEEQLGAALSFHYNTGAIKKASWVTSFNEGAVKAAEDEIMNWTRPASLKERRSKERDLFFHGRWSNDGTSLVIPVSKPSYHPAFGKARRIDISEYL